MVKTRQACILASHQRLPIDSCPRRRPRLPCWLASLASSPALLAYHCNILAAPRPPAASSPAPRFFLFSAPPPPPATSSPRRHALPSLCLAPPAARHPRPAQWSRTARRSPPPPASHCRPLHTVPAQARAVPARDAVHPRRRRRRRRRRRSNCRLPRLLPRRHGRGCGDYCVRGARGRRGALTGHGMTRYGPGGIAAHGPWRGTGHGQRLKRGASRSTGPHTAGGGQRDKSRPGTGPAYAQRLGQGP